MRFKPLSIKTTTALAITVGVMMLFVIIGVTQAYFVRSDIKEAAGTQQLAMMARIVDDIDERLQNSLRVIERAALATPGDLVARPRALEQNLEGRAGFRALFDGVVVIGADGRILVSFTAANLAGADVNDREYFRIPIKTGAARIFGPIITRPAKDPIVVFAAPILNSGGTPVAVLAGSLRLLNPGFLGHLAQANVGKTGMFALFGHDRTIILSKDKSRIMTPGPAPGVSPYFDNVVAGKEGWEENTNSRGLHALYSYKPLASVPWSLVAAIPADEAFAALYHARERWLFAAAIMALMLPLLAWTGTRYFVSPLTTLRDGIRRMRNEPDAPQPLSVAGHTEIREIAQAFNDLMEERRSAETARRMLASILEATADFVAIADAEGGVRYVNPAYRRLRGIPPDAAVTATSIRDFLPPSTLELLEREAVPIATRAGVWVGEMAIYDSQRREVPVSNMMVAHRGPDGCIERFSVIMRDISAAHEAREALRVSEHKLRLITDNIPALVSYLDTEQRFCFVNRTYEEWFKVPPCNIAGRTLKDYYDQVYGEAAYPVIAPFIQHALQGETVMYERMHANSEGTRHFEITLVPDRDDSGRIRGLISIGYDITALKETEGKLQKMARHDPLTGMPNRSHFNDALAGAIARSRREGSMVALMYLDLDRFKHINDSLGHGAGDEVLKETAIRLTASVRGTDTVARLGGDEFVIVLERLHKAEEAHMVARKIIAAIRTPYSIKGQSLLMTTSIGVAFLDEETPDGNVLLHRADEALYAAKAAGRNSYQIAGVRSSHSDNGRV